MGSQLWHAWPDEMELLLSTPFLEELPGPSRQGKGLPDLETSPAGDCLGVRKVSVTVRLGTSYPREARDDSR